MALAIEAKMLQIPVVDVNGVTSASLFICKIYVF